MRQRFGRAWEKRSCRRQPYVVPDTPKKTGKDGRKDADLPEESGWELASEESGVSERPTLAPPFDLESYAKETRSLEERVDGVLAEEDDPVRAPSDTAITLPPPPFAPSTSESGGTPLSAPLSQRKAEPLPSSVARPVRGTGPQPALASSAIPSRPQNLLSLANMMAPSLPPQFGAPGLAVGSTQPSPKQAPVIGDGSALDLVDRKADTEPLAEMSSDPITEMRERFALGDYSGALVIAESLLEENPTHVEAREYADSCRSVLQQMYTARIGPLDRVPLVEVARDQLRWLSIDHRAGFVLSLVDGVSSLEMILDVSGMPALDALRILYELVQQRIISFR
jgi:hypothetical protein